MTEQFEGDLIRAERARRRAERRSKKQQQQRPVVSARERYGKRRLTTVVELTAAEQELGRKWGEDS